MCSGSGQRRVGPVRKEDPHVQQCLAVVHCTPHGNGTCIMELGLVRSICGSCTNAAFLQSGTQHLKALGQYNYKGLIVR